MNHSYLRRVLRNSCGEEWVIYFRDEGLRISERVKLKVPRLLPQETIRAIHHRLKANSTYLHGNPKHDYLLAGRVFCAACGYALCGQPKKNPNGKLRLYYRHAVQNGSKNCTARPRPLVPAGKLEAAVIRQLFELFGNTAAIERAVKAAVPDCEALLSRKARLEDDLAKIARARNRILGLIEREAVTDDQAEQQLVKLKGNEAALLSELDALAVTLAELPDPDALRCYAEKVNGSIMVYDDNGEAQPGGNDLGTFLSMIRADKREDQQALIDSVFDGGLPGSKPAGIYIALVPGSKPHHPHRWNYSLRGRVQLKGVVGQGLCR